MTNNEFIKLVKKKMDELDINNEELARRMSVSPSTISRYLKGDIENMRRDNIISMSKALNINPSVLMGWDEEDSETTIIINRKVASMSDEKKEKLLKLIDAAFDEE